MDIGTRRFGSNRKFKFKGEHTTFVSLPSVGYSYHDGSHNQVSLTVSEGSEKGDLVILTMLTSEEARSLAAQLYFYANEADQIKQKRERQERCE